MEERTKPETPKDIDPSIQRRIDKNLYLPKEVAEKPELYYVVEDDRGPSYSFRYSIPYVTKLKNALGFIKLGQSDKK